MKKILACLLSFAMLFALTACGGTKASSDAGYYKIYSMTEGGKTYDNETLKSMGMSDSIYIQLLEDGTGTMNIADDVTKITWKDKVLTKTEDGTSMKYTIEGDKLTMEEDDMKMIFQKSDGTPSPSKAASSESSESSMAESSESKPNTSSASGTSKATASPASTASASSKSTTSGGEFASGKLGDYQVKIIGAESFKDSNDADAIRFYYDFTNTSSEIVQPYGCFSTTATQDDYALVDAYASYDQDVPESQYSSASVEPSVTVRCAVSYSYKPTGGTLVFTLKDYVTEETMSQEFDAASLPGNGGTWEITPITNPTYIDSLPASGTIDEKYDVTIDHGEVVEGYDSEKILRVYYNITNNSDETITPYYYLACSAFQDGVGLSLGSAAETTDADTAADTDLAIGASTSAAVCYTLRSSDTVEFMVQNSWYEPVLGMKIPVS